MKAWAPSRTLALWVIVGLACAPLGGCRTKEADTPQAEAVLPVEKQVERGPVTLTVRADKPRITIAEKLELVIEVQAADGVDVKMPSFGEKLSEFEIRDFRERAAVPRSVKTDGGTTPVRVWTQEYVLESFLSGELEVPGFTVKFEDRRDPGKPVEGEIATDPFKIEVTSLLAGQFDPAKFKDIKGTVELPADRTRAWWRWTAAAAGVVALAAIVWLLRRRRRKAAEPTPLPPHEWAFFALQRLEEDRLVETGRVQEFYFRLSGIVREYIERRFGLMAPERTTPEFLAEVRSASELNTKHKLLLGEFLQAADMVKFARYDPAPSEVQSALTTARVFVDETTPGAEERQDGRFQNQRDSGAGRQDDSQVEEVRA